MKTGTRDMGQGTGRISNYKLRTPQGSPEAITNFLSAHREPPFELRSNRQGQRGGFSRGMKRWTVDSGLWTILLPIILFSFFLLSSCKKLQQEIPLNLPAFKSQMAVECYLGPPDPTQCSMNSIIGIQAAISNTQDYFAAVDLNSLAVKGAEVTISYDSAGQTYAFRLNEDMIVNDFDTANVKLYNYKYYKYSYSTDSIKVGNGYIHFPRVHERKVLHFHTGVVYKLRIDDGHGRVATSETQWLDTVSITKIQPTLNPRDTTYNLLVHWQDASYDIDYYRLQVKVLNMDSAAVKKRGQPMKQDVVFTDAINNGGELVVGGPYRYKKGDTLEVKIFHIRKEFYQYLRTVSAAVSAMGSPFGQPAAIASNINGGLGIFTVLPWSKRIITIK